MNVTKLAKAIDTVNQLEAELKFSDPVVFKNVSNILNRLRNQLVELQEVVVPFARGEGDEGPRPTIGTVRVMEPE